MVAVRVEGSFEVDEVYALVGDILPENVQVVAVKERVLERRALQAVSSLRGDLRGPRVGRGRDPTRSYDLRGVAESVRLDGVLRRAANPA